MESVLIYLLVLTRIASFLYTGIFFSIRGVPGLVKTGFSMLMSVLVYMTLETVPAIPASLLGYSLLVLNETVYGLALGFTTYLIFVTIQMAGQLIDIQIGFSVGGIYDPVSDAKVSIFGRFYYWLSLALFLALDIHQFMIRALAQTYVILPLASGGLEGFFNLGFMSIFTDSLKSAFQIALPLVMILFLTDIVMGMVARAVPQINVFILGMPLKVLVGIVVMIVLIPAFAETMSDAVEILPQYLDKVIKSFAMTGVRP